MIDNFSINYKRSLNVQKEYLDLEEKIKITNNANDALNYSIIARGFPVEDLSSEFKGVTIKKDFYDMDGNAIDIQNLQINQGDLFFCYYII